MDTYLALWAFIAAMVATPGPANMLLMTAERSKAILKPFPSYLGYWPESFS